MVKSKPSMTASVALSSAENAVGFDEFFDRWESGAAERSGTSMLQTWKDMTGDYDPPEVVGDAEFDDLAGRRGYVQLYRGSSESAADDFASAGRYAVNDGMYGAGTYFTEGRSEAARHGEVVTEALLKPSAKTARFNTVISEYAGRYESIDADMGMVAAYARSQGYDVLLGPRSNQHYVVLNRAALVVRKR